MSRHNRGRTSLRLRHRRGDPMRDYDALPPVLRAWLAQAVLPWRPRSAARAFARALARRKSVAAALQDLDRLQARLIDRDSRQVWGPEHPGPW